MGFYKIILLSFFSIVVLFALTTLMGKKQMSQLSMFDYVSGITIGSIAAEMATALDGDYWQPIVAMCVYAVVSLMLTKLTGKSLLARRLFTGRVVLLMDNGIIYKKNMDKAKIDITEFLCECRINGFFNIDDIQTAILEHNGKISFIPVSNKRPVNTKDLSLHPEQEKLLYSVIIDGNILTKNLKATGNNESWLYEELERQQIKDLNEIFIATCDADNKVTVYLNNYKEISNDMFQ